MHDCPELYVNRLYASFCFCIASKHFLFLSLFLCISGWVCPEPLKTQSLYTPLSCLLHLTSLFPYTATSSRETDISSGGPGCTKSPRRVCLTRCPTVCYRSRHRSGSMGPGVVVMPAAAVVGAMDIWWGWGVSWAPVRFRTSATVFTS